MMSTNIKAQKTDLFKWGELAPIPDPFGFAGSFAGISNNALIVAGGANFPDGGAPWTGSKKVWTDKIFVLDHPTGKWKQIAKLGQPLGYGVSITYKNELICIGGSNAEGHVPSMFGINYYPNGNVEFEVWPDLPTKLANACGAVVGHTLYIAGGLLVSDANSTASVFLSIDLASQNPKWTKLETWPGPPRMLSVAGSLNGSFYLFSGTDLEDKNGAAHRKYLKDAYAYTPGKGWKKLADLPSPVVAAAGPALAYGKNELLVFGGDDGVLADNASTLKEKHPGFSDAILSYQIITNKWNIAGHIKTHKLADAAENPNKSLWAPVTTTSVSWHGDLVFPGGEVRPAVRTPRVLVAHIKTSPLINKDTNGIKK
ncbi:MAG: Kelch repeat type 1-containing protein [Mucilaginibacter sp.]|nr:Kelch repeat type 1-containing protein [Mucilaginibacter sp.]